MLAKLGACRSHEKPLELLPAAFFVFHSLGAVSDDGQDDTHEGLSSDFGLPGHFRILEMVIDPNGEVLDRILLESGFDKVWKDSVSFPSVSPVAPHNRCSQLIINYLQSRYHRG